MPDHADDTSTAFREHERPRFNDSPPAMPADTPQGVDEYGTTAAEERAGEPLARRLAREEPESPARPAESSEAAEPATGLAEAGAGDGLPEPTVPELDTPEAGGLPEVDMPEIQRTPEGGVPEGEFPDRP